MAAGFRELRDVVNKLEPENFPAYRVRLLIQSKIQQQKEALE